MERRKERSEFSKWRINLDHYSLENGKEEMFIEPRLLKLLNFLSANANKVIKRTELLNQVWEDAIVTEESLTKAVFDLRKFLLNFQDGPQILTIRKVGYKLVAPAPRRKYRIFRLAGKVVAYGFLIFLLFAIAVRAFRY